MSSKFYPSVREFDIENGLDGLMCDFNVEVHELHVLLSTIRATRAIT